MTRMAMVWIVWAPDGEAEEEEELGERRIEEREWDVRVSVGGRQAGRRAGQAGSQIGGGGPCVTPESREKGCESATHSIG